VAEVEEARPVEEAVVPRVAEVAEMADPALSINAATESAMQLCAWHVDALNQNRRLAVRVIAAELVVRPAVGRLGEAARPEGLVVAPEAVMGAVKAKLVRL